MSAGELPFATYHRASQVGEGTYGSVVTVYNDDGEEFALKLFVPDDTDGGDDDDDDNEQQQPIDLGALREISCLRLLRRQQQQQHASSEETNRPNIVHLHDIQPEWIDESCNDAGAGTAGCLGMALPLYKAGSLADAIQRKTLAAFPRRVKVGVAHDILSAVAYLHDNGILHRDIKSDNVLLQVNDDDDDDDGSYQAVLIDFSLAKPVDDTIYYGKETSSSLSLENEKETDNAERPLHTGEVGTLVYNAPEVLNREGFYGKPMDLWSVGVILLELLLNESIGDDITKTKEVEAAIQQGLDRLPSNQPFPDLVRGLLQKDPALRLTARQTLEHPLFCKFGLEVPDVQFVHVAKALPYAGEDDTDDSDDKEENPEVENSPPNACSNHRLSHEKRQEQSRLEKRLKAIERACQILGSHRTITRLAALEYSQQMEQLDDTLDDDHSQTLLDCVVLAHRFFEVHVLDLEDMADQDKGLFANWTLEEYVDNEATLFMILDYCLYPRNPRFDMIR